MARQLEAYHFLSGFSPKTRYPRAPVITGELARVTRVPTATPVFETPVKKKGW
jgi:hypothetical protein